MPQATLPRKFQQSPARIPGANSYSKMGYQWESMLTKIPGQYHVIVKYKGKEIYNVISDSYTTEWIIEEHIKINERK